MPSEPKPSETLDAYLLWLADTSEKLLENFDISVGLGQSIVDVEKYASEVQRYRQWVAELTKLREKVAKWDALVVAIVDDSPELITNLEDAGKWREHEVENPHGCRSISVGYHDVADLYDEDDPMPDIRSPNYEREMAEWIKRHTKGQKDADNDPK